MQSNKWFKLSKPKHNPYTTFAIILAIKHLIFSQKTYRTNQEKHRFILTPAQHRLLSKQFKHISHQVYCKDNKIIIVQKSSSLSTYGLSSCCKCLQNATGFWLHILQVFLVTPPITGWTVFSKVRNKSQDVSTHWDAITNQRDGPGWKAREPFFKFWILILATRTF